MVPRAEAPSRASNSVLVVGASRGLGLGLAKVYASHGWNVIATERRLNTSEGLRAATAAANGRIRVEAVEVNDAEAVHSLHRLLANETFDVIFVVAGVNDDPTRPIHEVSVEEFTRVLITNAYSPMRFAELFFDTLKPDGTVAIMSSRMGSVELASTYVDAGWEVYRASKAALNMLARCFYDRHRNAGRTVLLMHPGVVKTDMGGENAPVEVATSVEGIYRTVSNWHGSGKQGFVDYLGNVLPW
jgi:NAD(P)-dependent dehydrogenase (short-subunit alcohol dehydrogenase family)